MYYFDTTRHDVPLLSTRSEDNCHFKWITDLKKKRVEPFEQIRTRQQVMVANENRAEGGMGVEALVVRRT